MDGTLAVDFADTLSTAVRSLTMTMQENGYRAVNTGEYIKGIGD